jgi:hypothetical protein
LEDPYAPSRKDGKSDFGSSVLPATLSPQSKNNHDEIFDEKGQPKYLICGIKSNKKDRNESSG